MFVRAARGSSIDVGLFHDDQKRSVATVEGWFNAGDKVGTDWEGLHVFLAGVFGGGGEGTVPTCFCT